MDFVEKFCVSIFFWFPALSLPGPALESQYPFLLWLIPKLVFMGKVMGIALALPKKKRNGVEPIGQSRLDKLIKRREKNNPNHRQEDIMPVYRDDEEKLELPLGYRLQKYELMHVLGSGGFGITYLGKDHNLNRPVAIKEYFPLNSAMRRTSDLSVVPQIKFRDKFEQWRKRFLDEARTLARFDHRHIIKVYDFFEAHNTGYIVMEYAEGEPLSAYLKRKGVLTESELKEILFPLLDGLKVVHGAKFLHRDIKPGNIVIRAEDGSPVLIDFGAARQAIGTISGSLSVILTPGYAPVEQYSTSGDQGPWTDIYALGAVCYRALTGAVPDDAIKRMIGDAPLVPIAERCAEDQASRGFLSAIDHALQVNKEDRPQTIGAWRAKLVPDKPHPPRPGETFKDCAEGPQMVVVPPGWFMMGSPSSEEGRYAAEGPQHRVEIGYRLAVGVYAVTFAEWDACVASGGCDGYRPSDAGWGRGRRPVINVSWDDAQAYVSWLSNKTGHSYRLLSESEWEYVARAGTVTPFHFGETISTSQANYDGNYMYGSGRKGVYREQTLPVGSFPPNAFGLYDVHGNVWEWTQDCWNGSYSGAPGDGSSWERGACSLRVLRGGSWLSEPRILRSAIRFRDTSVIRNVNNGFRVARRF